MASLQSSPPLLVSFSSIGGLDLGQLSKPVATAEAFVGRRVDGQFASLWRPVLLLGTRLGLEFRTEVGFGLYSLIKAISDSGDLV